ncbi:MAG: YgiQ family radical SAM protein [Pseudomonadales bacterium]|nr:YgiQ family radical SAM protein [Pseudomonadales bacterium]
MNAAKPLFSYRKFWAECYGPAPFLPRTRAEMDELGWDSCDVIVISGDAYIDHPSFGAALIGRLLEAQGYRVGIIAQPDWRSVDDFKALGKPNLYFGVTAGNMDSMVNRYTSDRKIRSNDAYTAGGEANRRPDRATIVYTQRCREAYKNCGVVLGGIEGSLRRAAHYDYWSDKVRRSILVDTKADILLYGNAERALVELTHRIAGGEHPSDITDLRGTVFVRKNPELTKDWIIKDSTSIDTPGVVDPHPDPYEMKEANNKDASCNTGKQPVTEVNPVDGQPIEVLPEKAGVQVVQLGNYQKAKDRAKTLIQLPSYNQVLDNPSLYAHASRVLHLESNPGNARPMIQGQGQGPGSKEIQINPPPIPLTTEELDWVYELPYARQPHPSYEGAKIPAWDMIRFSVNIMRGCFGGCTFCSITEHEGRIIQSRSEQSVLNEIANIRDKTDGFTGTISDLGGPTANMYRLACNDPKIESSCRRLSCVFPGICKNLNTDHTPLINLYRKAREIPGVKRVLIASGLRYDLAVRSPEYVKELVTHHVGGYLKIAPEHTEDGPLNSMMKPGIGAYEEFREMFEKFSAEAGKEQYLIPYFIAAHPGTTNLDMLNLALWLKKNKFRLDQVQTFLPTPMAMATAMYHSEQSPLVPLKRRAPIPIPRKAGVRKLHKAFLRYHDPENWPLLREALKELGRTDLIGNTKQHLIPTWQPKGTGGEQFKTSNGRPAMTTHNHFNDKKPAGNKGKNTSTKKAARKHSKRPR